VVAINLFPLMFQNDSDEHRICLVDGTALGFHAIVVYF